MTSCPKKELNSRLSSREKSCLRLEKRYSLIILKIKIGIYIFTHFSKEAGRFLYGKVSKLEFFFFCS